MIAWTLWVVVVFWMSSGGAEGAIGMNWGRQSAQRLLPSQVVDLLLQNGIRNARVYTAQKDILAAFAGSGINLTVSNYDLTRINTMEKARAYVNDRKAFYGPSSIRTMLIGDYVFDKSKGRDAAVISSTIDTLRLMQAAIDEARLPHRVHANIIHYDLGLFSPNITKPSEAEFPDEYKEVMLQFLQFLRENDAPFNIQMFPLEATKLHKFDPSFAFPDNNSSTVITDDANGFVYTNLFEWQFDCYVWALTKLNFSDIRIVVTQIGWPTDGYAAANVSNAERFWKHLLPMVVSNKGTPMRPGAPIDVFVHALADETMMGDAFARHWGIYHSNGQPKYKIDLTGQGRDINPSTIKGIMRMARRWCVFNGDRHDFERVNYLFKWTCNQTDCSSLAPGGSCGNLTFAQNVSFAFNMYFQFNFQDELVCDYGGLAQMTTENPSTGHCVFPVEVVKGQQDNYKSRSQQDKNKPFSSHGFHHRPDLTLFVFWVWISAIGEMFLM